MRNLAALLLEHTERLFLFSHGWVRKENGRYDPPASYQAGSKNKHGDYTRSHAVNSQKQYVYNSAKGGTRLDPDLDFSTKTVGNKANEAI